MLNKICGLDLGPQYLEFKFGYETATNLFQVIFRATRTRQCNSHFVPRYHLQRISMIAHVLGKVLCNLIKHFTIVIYYSRVVLTANLPILRSRVVIYDCKIFRR